jgi:hypothetical protein
LDENLLNEVITVKKIKLERKNWNLLFILRSCPAQTREAQT